jgi:hypothetical protein
MVDLLLGNKKLRGDTKLSGSLGRWSGRGDRGKGQDGGGNGGVEEHVDSEEETAEISDDEEQPRD